MTVVDLAPLAWCNDRGGRWHAQGDPLFDDAAVHGPDTVAVSVWPTESGLVGVLETRGRWETMSEFDTVEEALAAARAVMADARADFAKNRRRECARVRRYLLLLA